MPYTAIESGDIDPAKNRFTSGTGTAYDDGGQVVTDNKFRALGYGYDANGRMVVSSQANTPDAVSVYDALGNRVAEKVNDVWQFVIYDAFGRLVAEYGGTSAQDSGGVKFYLQDWQGSVRAGVNAGGYVKSRTDHQAFGEDIASGVGLRSESQGFDAPATNRQGYGLTEKDSATGLNHTWFRKNENRAGRWTSPDPYNGSASVGNPQSWNRYSYVGNQPTNFVDPSGLVFVGYPYSPMGISYYVDGVLSDARTAWSILNSGGGFIDFTNIPGIDVIDLYSGGERNYRYGQNIHFFQYLDFSSAQWILIGDAYGIAGQALNQKTCRDAITSGTVAKPPNLAGDGDPRDVLRNIIPKGDEKGSLKFDPAMTGAFAASGITENPTGFIRLGPLFFGTNLNLPWVGTAPNLSDEYLRALILLHEIKHIITGDYNNPNHGPAYNTAIYDACFKNLKIK